MPHMDTVMGILKMIAKDRKNDCGNKVPRKACGLVEAIASSLGAQIKEQIHQPFVMKLLKEGGTPLGTQR